MCCTGFIVSDVWQVLCILSSWFTVSWALVSFDRALRLSQHLDPTLLPKCIGAFIQLVWRLLTVAARGLAFVMFASHFKGYLFVIVGGHWLLMLVWMCPLQTTYCTFSYKGKKYPNCFLEKLFRFLGACIHIFCFFNLIGGHTRLRAVVFYTLVYMENVGMILAWYVKGHTEIPREHAWYVIATIVMVFIGFFVGIVFMLIYYRYWHTQQIPAKWVPLQHLSLFKDPDADDHTGPVSSPTDQATTPV